MGKLVPTLTLMAAYLMSLNSIAGYHTWRTLEPEPIKAQDPSAYAAMAALVEPHGYSLEQHFIPTSDGYILGAFRMGPPGAESAHGGSPRPAVLLQHALMDSSAGWVIMGPGKGLAFMLADAGYDVWMSNTRGNRFSLNHTRLDVEDPAFWAFSWDHMGQYDVPAAVSYILNRTGQQRLAYVGYSQVSVAALLAPVAFVTHIRSKPFLAGVRMRVDKLLARLDWHQWGRHDVTTAGWASDWCGRWSSTCLGWLESLCGANPRGNLDRGMLPLVYQYLPAGTSVQNMIHWAQSVRRREPSSMQSFDYGSTCRDVRGRRRPCNEDVYGQAEPPRYNLSRIATPLALFSGGQDTLSTPEDLSLLLRVLPAGIVVQHDVEPDYAHLDFGLGMDAHVQLFPRVIDVLQRYSPTAAEPTAAAAAAPGAAVAA